nr:lysylphosphatidylglycerol synthase domain-containing protein [Flavobacterium sp. 9AF]
MTIAITYIYHELNHKKIDWFLFSKYITWKQCIILILFSSSNWFLEILKWQNLVSYFKRISILQSLQQTLGSLTSSIFTPNRIGEYVAKAFYYPKKETKKILFLNFISNTSQMFVTCFFGIIGIILYQLKTTQTLFWFSIKIKTTYLIVFIIITIAFFIFFKFKKIRFYGFTIQKFWSKCKRFPKTILITNFQLSILRYLIFSHQFYYLLLIFQCEINYSSALSIIFMMYLFASILPSIHIMDVAVKGSVAVYLFGKFGIEEWKIILITFIMWFFNLVFPVLIGSYFVLQFKPKKT